VGHRAVPPVFEAIAEVCAEPQRSIKPDVIIRTRMSAPGKPAACTNNGLRLPLPRLY
jgi:hypothetical protein